MPTLEEINDNEVTKLSQRLKEISDKETLTKIVEWQERNLIYWTDRASMFKILYILLILSFLLLPIPQIARGILIPIISLFALLDIMFILPYIIILITSIICFFALIFLVNFQIGNKLFPLFNVIILSTLLGGILSLVLYLIFKYRNIKLHHPEFSLGDTFKLSLPVDKILKYRLAICRDYAKLTAALLINMYPKNKIHFVLVSGHVAAAIKINNKLYVLDQRLPIFTLENWLAFWKETMNKKKLKVEILEMIVELNHIKTKKTESKVLSETKIPKLNMKSLKNEISNLMKLKESSKKDSIHLRKPLKNFAFCYDEDPIIKFSLVRSFIIELENEFCGNLNIISKIDIMQDSKDLILKVYTNKFRRGANS